MIRIRTREGREELCFSSKEIDTIELTEEEKRSFSSLTLTTSVDEDYVEEEGIPVVTKIYRDLDEDNAKYIIKVFDDNFLFHFCVTTNIKRHNNNYNYFLDRELEEKYRGISRILGREIDRKSVQIYYS